MKHDPLNQFINLRKTLLNEKATILARLQQIDRTLGTAASPVLAMTVAPAPTAPAAKPQRKMSKAARTKISAGQKARWLMRKGGKNAADVAPAPKKRVLSPAGRAAISAAAKARWAKKRAAGQKPA